ncbi:MAG: hypothetical protein AB7J32_13125 [Pseudonocardia sp.]
MSTRTGRAHAGTRTVKAVGTEQAEVTGGQVNGKVGEPQRSVTIDLPPVTAQVRTPQLPKIPGQDVVTGAVGTAAAGIATAARGVAGAASDAARGVAGAAGDAARGVAGAAGDAARGAAGVAADAADRTRRILPSAPVLFYAGLAATAAFGVISWPVAVAIGVGTAVARASTGAAAEKAEKPEKAEKAGQAENA